MSDRQRQQAYLEAMGFTIWVPENSAGQNDAPEAEQGEHHPVGRPSGRQPEQDEAPEAEQGEHHLVVRPSGRQPVPNEALGAEETAPKRQQPEDTPQETPSTPLPLDLQLASLPDFPQRQQGRVLIVCGEAEGDEGQGDPYEGELAQLFSDMIKATRWTPEMVVLASHATPARQAIQATGADVIMGFGRAACRELWGVGALPEHLRGRAVPLFGAQAIATHHPILALADASFKRPIWEDIKRAIEVLAP
ncbi:hypothetical protein GP5015_517 [gamma proteobacterium HTCC5015]|nr:hypothetical protein GP5015_517 [gamma proteobacterium HTCC5015]